MRQTMKITMLGSGSKPFGGMKSIGLTKQEVHQIARKVSSHLSSLKCQDKRRSAVVEFGLPYAADPAVRGKHVAEF